MPGLGRACDRLDLTFVVPRECIDRVRSYFEPAFGRRLAVVGWQSREDLIKTYRAHDILLFPSLFEGFGKVFLEAMACGLCVVGFDEGGLSDVTASGESAVYCSAGDEESFIRLLKRCISDDSYVRDIGTRGREVATSYTWDRNAMETVEFCQALRQSVATGRPASVGMCDGPDR
jgi:glycosyltransferase involved in cell wall biosynthesis